MGKNNFDIVVIGTGTAGYYAAHGCAKAGLEVAVIDKQAYGGTCAKRGCQPKKYLIAAAEVADLSRNMSEIGISPQARISWSELQKSKNAFVDKVSDGSEQGFEKAEIYTLHGEAKFISAEKLEVAGEEIVAENYVIATGAIPRPLRIPGEELVLSSDDFLSLDSMPRKIAFIGGGFISFEFAHVAKRAGAQVVVLQRGDSILKQFDSEMSKKLLEASIAEGIEVVTNYAVCHVEKEEDHFVVSGDKNCSKKFSADAVFHGAGRVPDINNLGLDKAGIEFSNRGIPVNEYLQSSNPKVYAVGDVAATPYQLATTGDREGAVCAENIISGNTIELKLDVVPSTVFTLPPLATVGMSEEDVEKSEHKFSIKKGSMASWPSSKRIGQKDAFYKIITEENSQKILGAHILGHNAGEAINVFAMAMKFGLTTEDLKEMIWAYPTYVSDTKYMI